MVQHKAFLLCHSSVTDEAWYEMCPAQRMTSYNISLNMPFNKIRYTGVSIGVLMLLWIAVRLEHHTSSVGFPQELFPLYTNVLLCSKCQHNQHCIVAWVLLASYPGSSP